MEPMADNSQNQFTAGQCVLKVMQGKHQGLRKVLKSPVTLLGAEKGCDIRLNSTEVEQLQCVIVETPEGYLVRNLYDCQKVVVNGEPMEISPLHTGDELSIGPFSFLVEYAQPALQKQYAPSPEAQIDEERQALRVQAAAVVSQQSSLMEQEILLRDQTQELSQKEKQLAASLREKHLRLLQLQRSLKSKSSTLKQQEISILGQLQEKEAQVARESEQAKQVKSHYEQLRKRFKGRWKKVARRAIDTLSQKEKLLASGLARLKKEREGLERVISEQANTNGQQRTELAQEKRELRSGWDKLEAARQEASRKAQEAELLWAQKEKDLAAREARLSAGEKGLVQEQKRWNNHLEKLHLESEGLERRITLLRTEMNPLPMPAPMPEPQTPKQPAPEEVTAFMGRLEQIASTLYDQRLRLLEAWDNIERKRMEFHDEKTRIIGELEAAGKALVQREKHVEASEYTLQLRQEQVREKSRRISELRNSLEARASLLETGKIQLAADKVNHDALWKQRSSAMEKMFTFLQDSRRNLCKRRQAEQVFLQKQQDRSEDLRQNTAKVWQQCQAKLEELETQRESLAIQELALGRLSLELLAKASDASGAERKLEKLRKGIEDRYKGDSQRLLDAREQLTQNAAMLESRWKELYRAQGDMHLRAEDVIQLQSQFDEAHQESSLQRINLEGSVKLLKTRNTELEKKLQLLQQELEKLHSVLISESQEEDQPPALILRAA